MKTYQKSDIAKIADKYYTLIKWVIVFLAVLLAFNTFFYGDTQEGGARINNPGGTGDANTEDILWEENLAGDVILKDITDLVGIGTDDPQSGLDVDGDTMLFAGTFDHVHETNGLLRFNISNPSLGPNANTFITAAAEIEPGVFNFADTATSTDPARVTVGISGVNSSGGNPFDSGRTPFIIGISESRDLFIANAYNDGFKWVSNSSDDGQGGNIDTLAAHLTATGTMTLLADAIVADDPYDSSWDGLMSVPTKNAVYDKIESLNGDISVKATKTSDQSIPRITITKITWDSEKYDTDDMHDNATNNTRITFNTAGKYSILAQAEWEISNEGFRFLEIIKNGAGSGIARVRYVAEAASENIIAYVGEFEVGDYIELQVFQDTGGGLDFKSGTGVMDTYLEVHKIN